MLRAQVSAAASVNATIAAYVAFSASLEASAGVLGQLVEVSVVTQASLDVAVTATVQAAATLDAALALAVSATGSIDVNAVANTVVTAFDAFDTVVMAQATALAPFGGKAAPAVSLLLVAEGSFRMRSGPPAMSMDMGTSDGGGADLSAVCSPACMSGSYCDVDTCKTCNVDAHCGTSCMTCGGGTPRCNGTGCVECTMKSHCTNVLAPCCSSGVCVAGVC
jgi:hypothetical protein